MKDLERPDSKALFPCVVNALHCNKTVNKLGPIQWWDLVLTKGEKN